MAPKETPGLAKAVVERPNLTMHLKLVCKKNWRGEEQLNVGWYDGRRRAQVWLPTEPGTRLQHVLDAFSLADHEVPDDFKAALIRG